MERVLRYGVASEYVSSVPSAYPLGRHVFQHVFQGALDPTRVHAA